MDKETLKQKLINRRDYITKSSEIIYKASKEIQQILKPYLNKEILTTKYNLIEEL